jgi:hypothetical protein
MVSKVAKVGSVLVILALCCLSRLGIAQYITPVTDVLPRTDRAVTDPCQDPSIPSALKESLHLVCTRLPVAAANHGIRAAIILGFVGGYVKRDDVNQPEVLFAAYLQRRYGSAVHVEVFGNHEWRKAIEETTRHIDTDKDSFLSVAEKEQKIILYGHSWGASQLLTFARELQRRRIPVALTIQVDSVKKFGQDDHTVPANVAKAVNFYQRKGFTPGQPFIVPADPAQTKILGNFHMKYERHQINCSNYRWLSRVFNKPHHQIENDPEVWDRITSLIDSEVLKTDPEMCRGRTGAIRGACGSIY